MNSSSGTTEPVSTNDGGIVLSLFLMVGAIYYAMYTSITVYVNNKNKVRDSDETTTQALVRILSGWSNIGNSVVHVLLIIYIKANEGSVSAYWERERELEADGIGGPLGLVILNLAAGMCSIHQKHLYFSLVWNSFAVVAGILIPIVWLRFIEVGLNNWPLIIIFIWFLIFAMELSAFSTSWTYYFIEPKDSKTKKDD